MLNTVYMDQRKGYDIAARFGVKKYSTRMETLKRLLIANDYINDNLTHSISLEEISRVSALSRFHLYSSFKKLYGQTPHQYINRLKMAKARNYIMTGEYTINEIADLFGYNDASVFGIIFKKIYGRSPSNYFDGNLN
ncbi:AraC-type DNA-binding protein [Arenibacter palladensis]|uniref:AraC-type DNA-binding protein n=1 Tax=Arenibacter palladensis TaxID=237373 RepID=A0A1M4XYT3_9FLAO|nr:AraC family transcriptional regulator [Arenibacter palladensis]SHE98506.1 AraC-type DNA-binding protein [Arenibacter palladensis]